MTGWCNKEPEIFFREVPLKYFLSDLLAARINRNPALHPLIVPPYGSYYIPLLLDSRWTQTISRTEICWICYNDPVFTSTSSPTLTAQWFTKAPIKQYKKAMVTCLPFISTVVPLEGRRIVQVFCRKKNKVFCFSLFQGMLFVDYSPFHQIPKAYPCLWRISLHAFTIKQ